MDKIAVLDFGGQYTHLIANRIRRLKVYSEILPSETNADELINYKGLVLSGSPSSVFEENAPDCDSKIFDLNIPVLGICYGHQLIAKKLGGDVINNNVGEYGKTPLNLKTANSLFKNLNVKQNVWMNHRDYVKEAPAGFEKLASTKDCPTAAMGNLERKIYSVQFHPEVTHTEKGSEILNNFVHICGCEQDWRIEHRLPYLINEIKEEVGDKKVFTLVSGGVDSTVLFALLGKAVGRENIRGLHIDTGLMRKNESSQVYDSLQNLGYKLDIENAASLFFEKLKNIYDPEQKRKLIGDLIFEIAQQKEKEFGLDSGNWLFSQGTIYPDTIESGGTDKSSKIKSHHNRSPLSLELISSGKIIEPLKEFYKDEIREIGSLLGLPNKLVKRHPFPGPGLGVRILTIPETRISLPQLTSLLGITKLNYKILPVKTVGVQGDDRTYSYAIGLYGRESWENLEIISSQITNKFKGKINRVVYCLSSDKPPENFYLKSSSLTLERAKITQEADSIFMNYLFDNKLMEEVNQAPVVLLPIGISRGHESIVLRPVKTVDYMTAEFAKIDKEIMKKITKDIMEIKGIDSVFYDITHKPPGTIEWE